MTLTFTPSTPNAAVTITGKIVYGTDWYDVRKNHFRVETAEAGEAVYDVGPTVCYLTLVLKDVSLSDGDALREFFKENVDFGSVPFTLEQESTPIVNIGQGTSVNYITGVTLNQIGTLEDCFTPVAPGKYDITLPLKFRR